MESLGRIHGLLYACLASLVLLSVSGQTKESGQLVADRALSLVGIREKGCNNCGLEVEWIISNVKLTKGIAWCGACSYTAHLLAGCEPEGDPKQYAWVPSWFRKDKVIWRPGEPIKNILPGDQIALYFPSLKRDAHMGTIIEVEKNGRWVRTVEGNTNASGGREGQGVYIQRRAIASLSKISRHHY